MKQAVSYYKVHFLGLEMLGAVLLALIFYCWTEHGNGLSYVGGFVKENRGAIYGALVSLFGTMLGFSIATVSIVLGLVFSERLEVLRNSKHYPVLWKIFASTNWVLAISTAIALVGLVFDRDKSPVHILMHLNLMFLILSVFRVARCVWVLEKIITIITSPSKASSVPPAVQPAKPP